MPPISVYTKQDEVHNSNIQWNESIKKQWAAQQEEKKTSE